MSAKWQLVDWASRRWRMVGPCGIAHGWRADDSNECSRRRGSGWSVLQWLAASPTGAFCGVMRVCKFRGSMVGMVPEAPVGTGGTG